MPWQTVGLWLSLKTAGLKEKRVLDDGFSLSQFPVIAGFWFQRSPV